MMSSETNPLEQNENANASDRGPNTQTTQSSPQSKEKDQNTPAKEQQNNLKKPSLWKKAKQLVRLFMWSEAQKDKLDESKPDTGASSGGLLTDFINSYISHISEQKEYVEDHYKKLIDDGLRQLKDNYKTANDFKDPETKEKSLHDLKRDLMKLKLAIPSTNVEGAEKKEPLKNLQFSSSQLQKSLSEVPEKLPHLHRSQVFNSSMEFKHFVSRYKQLDLRMKLCLLCFSIFPQGAVIKKRLMVQWWVAEGYAESEEYAGKYFEEFTEKGFIEAVNVNRCLSAGSCQIHPFNRSALVALAEKANFFNFESGEKPTQNFEGCYQACLMGQGLISYEDFQAWYEMVKEHSKKKNESSKKGGSFKGLKNKNESENGADPDEDIKKKNESSKKGGSSKGSKNTNESENGADPDEEKGEDIKKKNESSKKGGSSKGSKDKNKSEKGVDPDEEKGQDSKDKANDQSSKGATPAKVTEALINELEKLHLLMNVDEHILEFKYKWFEKMRNLNILYLGRWTASAIYHIEVEDVEFLVKGLVNLRRVKLLSLQGVSNIISLPDSILKLTDLTVLDLRACYNLENIPDKIGRWLERLTHLDMSECYLLDHMPKSLSELKNLKVLKGFFVNGENPRNKKSCTLGDLEKLTELEKLCIYTNCQRFPEDEDVKDFGKLTKLSKLTITWGVSVSPSKKQSDEDEKQSDEGEEKKKTKEGKLPKSLTKLDLKCFPMSVTPDWLKIKNLEHTELKKLYIRGGNFSDLGQYQRIDEPYEDEKQWKKVEQLRLKYLFKIDMEWSRLQELFPNLKYLEQVSCPNLTLFPCDAKGVWTKSEGSRH